MQWHTRLALSALLIIRTGDAAASERCGDAADKALFSASSWRELRAWYATYADCDDGYMAEHVSTLVGEWLSRSPDEFKSLQEATSDSRSFEDHVIRHIGMTLSQSTTRRIRQNAEHCPTGADGVCARVIRALDELDEEVQRLRQKKE